MQKIYHDLGKAILFKDTFTRDLLFGVCEAAKPAGLDEQPKEVQLTFRLDPDEVEKAIRAEIGRLEASAAPDRHRSVDALSKYLTRKDAP